jgi:DNA-directed RNA polymerase subunit M/transcription elongation factor TFIIS
MGDSMRERVRKDLSDRGLPGTDVERAVYNNCIRRCGLNAVACCWGNSPFVETYKSAALSCVRNSDSILASLSSGDLLADVMARTPAERKPEIWSDLIQQKKARDAAYGAKPVANTSMYRCNKCGNRECHYYGLQTRSGDEPMTIFITCLTCGNRWRTEG